MNNSYIMYFSVYAVVARRTFISVALCSHLPQNVNDPDSASTFSPPHSPQTSKSKGKRERCCSCLYRRVLSEPAGPCLPPPEPQPLSQTALPRQSRRLPLAFLRPWPPRQATTSYRAPTEGPIVSASIRSVENPGRSPSSL